MKTCRDCLLEKPLDEFYISRRAIVGGGFTIHHFPRCKVCEKIVQQGRRRRRGILSRDEAQRKEYAKGERWVAGTDPTCRKCGITKGIEHFNCNLTKWGLRPIQSMCKSCKLEYLKEVYAATAIENRRVSGVKSNVRPDFQHTIITIDGEKIRIGRKVDREIEIKLRKNGYSFIFKGYGDK